MTRVFAYLRISTAQQRDGDGFPRQLAACRQFAEEKGFTIIRTFQEQQTGSDEFQNRAKMSEALQLCGPGTGVDTIIVERADRIARDVLISELFFAECRKLGVKVYGADSGEELVNATGDPTRTLIRQFLCALAQWDKAMIVKKLLAGRKRKKELTGVNCGGPLKYGFRPSEWRCVKVVLRRHRAGMGVREIARRVGRAYRRSPSIFILPETYNGNRRVKGYLLWNPMMISRIISYWNPRVAADLKPPQYVADYALKSYRKSAP